MVEHGGAWRGFRSHVVRFPDQKFGVVILSNLDTFPFSLTEEVIKLYLADALGPEESDPDTAAEPTEETGFKPLAPEQLTEFKGNYYTEELDTTYTIDVRGDQLVAQHIRHDDILLTYTDDHFVGDAWFFPEVHFTRDGTRRVTGFRLTGDRVRNLHFQKKAH